MKKLVLTIAVLTACGGNSEDSTVDSIPAEVAEKVQNQATENESENGSTSNVYLTKAELPTCDDSRKAHLAYVNDDLEFYGCDGKEWKPLIVKNEAEVVQEKMINCFFDHTESGEETSFNYAYIKYSDGTGMANVQTLSFFPIANTLVWGAGTVGAEQGVVTFLVQGNLNEAFLSADHKTLVHRVTDFTNDTKVEYTMSTDDANCSF